MANALFSFLDILHSFTFFGGMDIALFNTIQGNFFKNYDIILYYYTGQADIMLKCFSADHELKGKCASKNCIALLSYLFQ